MAEGAATGHTNKLIAWHAFRSVLGFSDCAEQAPITFIFSEQSYLSTCLPHCPRTFTSQVRCCPAHPFPFLAKVLRPSACIPPSAAVRSTLSLVFSPGVEVVKEKWCDQGCQRPWTAPVWMSFWTWVTLSSTLPSMASSKSEGLVLPTLLSKTHSAS